MCTIKEKEQRNTLKWRIYMKRCKSMTGVVLCLCMLIQLFPVEVSAVSLFDVQQNAQPTTAPSPGTGGVRSGKVVPYTIDGQEYRYQGEKVKVVYESRRINLDKTPAVIINGTVMVPIKQTFVKQGIKAEYKYIKKQKKIMISKNDKFIVMHLNDPSITVNQQTTPLPAAPVSVTYTKSKTKAILVPFREVVKALGINYLWDEDMLVAQLSKPVLNFVGKKTYTNYRWSLSQYAALQQKRTKRASVAEYKRLVDPKKGTSYGFQYLRLDRYREVDEEKFLSTYDYYIKNACENIGHDPEWSVLYGKGKVMLAAAKKYHIDPMYFVSQTFLESAHGTSKLARGNTISRAALSSNARSKGKFITKKIKKKVKVYNLYGINAYDSDPVTGATSYAYRKGWTTVDKAIYGAAKFISSSYFRAVPSQNTIFKFRYNPSNVNHQYATDPWYSEKIAQRMMLFSRCYSTKATYIYDYPKYAGR